MVAITCIQLNFGESNALRFARKSLLYSLVNKVQPNLIHDVTP